MTGNGSSLRVGVCLSLSEKFARFGNQALQGLRAWLDIEGSASLIVEDDASDPQVLPRVAAQSLARRRTHSSAYLRDQGGGSHQCRPRA